MPSPLEGTRLKIIETIRNQGSVNIAFLAQDIGLASATIRRHLDILQRDQLVSYRQVRKKLGRPEYVYYLTEEGHESGYRDYQKLLAQVLSTIKTLGSSDTGNGTGEELLQRVMVSISDKMSAPFAEPDHPSVEKRIANLREALTAHGYSPTITAENSHVCIRIGNCPYRAIALDEPLVCILDRQFIANILGVEPECKSTVRDGGTACSFVANFDA